MQFKNIILLTGAGFTANFGGFLAREMWVKIFNNPKLNKYPHLKETLKNNFNYEVIYSNVIEQKSNFQSDEIELFEQVVNEAYLTLDDVVKDRQMWESSGIDKTLLGEFLEFFRLPEEDKVGAVFTLNQDLFLERHYGWQPLGPSSMHYEGDFGNLNINDLNSVTPKFIPSKDDLDIFKSQLNNQFGFIKLHGSQKWVESEGENTKIIGINKKEAIARVPLLSWYFELFQQAISKQDIKLVIIGYGFKDEHINDCICQAVSRYGLKLYVISTVDPEDFSFNMRFKYPRGVIINERDESRLPIWNGVEGYFPYLLKEIFPYRQQTSHRIEIFKAIGIPLG